MLWLWRSKKMSRRYEAFKTVEGKDNWFVFSEVHVKFVITQTTRVNFRTSEFQQVDHIDEADL